MSRLSEDYAHVVAQLKADCLAAFEIASDKSVYTFPSVKANDDKEFVVIERGDEGVQFQHDTPVSQALRLPFKITAYKQKSGVTDVDTEKVRLFHQFHDRFAVRHYADQGAGSEFRGCWRSLVTAALRSTSDDPKKDYFTVDVDCEAWIAVSRGDYEG